MIVETRTGAGMSPFEFLPGVKPAYNTCSDERAAPVAISTVGILLNKGIPMLKILGSPDASLNYGPVLSFQKT